MPGRRRPQARPSESGNATVQVVLITPALLLALMLIVQFGLAYHAKSVAQSAAQMGAAQARKFHGSAGAAAAETRKYLGDLAGGGLIRNRGVHASRTGQAATVVVTGSVVSLVPFLHIPVQEVASGPVERFVQPVNHGGQP